MRLRKKSSSGQALVMVTLSLMAMSGLMGLAVDLGWSFFVQQEAQSAADGAAMAAVQAAYANYGGNFGNIVCGSSSTCSSTPAVCPNAPGNLLNACLYASKNGFTGAAGSHQQVTVQANTGNLGLPPGTAGLTSQNVPYWVRVVAVQTVPQLFSAFLGKGNAVVSSSSVAGITGNSSPASLVLLDRPNDCFAGSGGYGGFFGGDYFGRGNMECGENIDMTSCSNCSITATGPIYLASTCNGNGGGGYGYGGYGYGGGHSGYGCGSSPGDNGNNYAGNAGGGGGFGDFGGGNGNSVTSLAAIQVQTPGNVTGGNWMCAGSTNNCPQQIAAASIFLDPTTGERQPPITATGPVATCGVLNGVLNASQWGNNNNLTVGPYSYYAYTVQNHRNVPTGDPIRVSGNVTFSNSGSCPGILGNDGSAQAYPQFPTYIFYGGMVFDNGSYNGSNVYFGPGQYVMVGINGGGYYGNDHDYNDSSCDNSLFCFDNSNVTVSGDINAGTMFIFTSPNNQSIGTRGASDGTYYPGLSTQINGRSLVQQIIQAAPNEGNVNFQQASFGNNHPLTGVVAGASGVPSTLNQYNGLLFWQDRANSTVQYDSTGHVQYDSSGNVIANRNPPPSGANAMSVIGFFAWWGWGGAQTTLNGVIYQPRGAYLTDYGFNWWSWWGHGGGVNVTAQVITGAVYLSGNGTQLTLGTPTHPLTNYTMSMIQ